jgi:hypothetical protein
MFTNVILNVIVCKRITLVMVQNFEVYVFKRNYKLLSPTWFTCLKGKKEYFQGQSHLSATPIQLGNRVRENI